MASFAKRFPEGGTARNAIWLVGAQLVGLLATLIATPVQLDRMGPERYGVIVVVAATLVQLGLVEFGSAFAVLRGVPWHLARGDDTRARALVGAGLWVTAAMGTIAGATLWLVAPSLAGLFQISASTLDPAIRALHVAAFCLPLMMMGGTMSAIGRALDMFRLNAIILGSSLVAFNAVWAAVAGREDDLVLVMAGQLVLAVAAVLAWSVAITRVEPSYARPGLPSKSAVRELISFGGKASAGQASLNVVMQADKLLLASLLRVSALPAYSIPFSVAFRIMLVTNSLTAVLLPRLATIASSRDITELRRLARAAYWAVSVPSGALAVLCVFAGQAFLEVWVGADFAADAQVPLTALAIGFAFMGVGSVGQTFLQAAGRPGLTAALTFACSAVALGLGAAGAAVLGTTSAAAIGIAAGLGVMGLGGVELSRRLVLDAPVAPTYLAAFGPWAGLAAAGGAAWAVTELAGASAVMTIVAVTLATLLAVRRADSRRETVARAAG